MFNILKTKKNKRKYKFKTKKRIGKKIRKNKRKNKLTNKRKKTKKILSKASKIRHFNAFIKKKGYPYKNVSKNEAVKNFLKLKMDTKNNPRSHLGIRSVNYGTEKNRVRTKYRNYSLIERWNNPVRKKKMLEFARKLYLGKWGKNKDVKSSVIDAISLQWGTINTMRPSFAKSMYQKYNATRVLDITAGWGSRMVAAMAAGVDYVGIDSNKSLKPGYDKMYSTFKKHSKSKVRMIYSKAEKVDFSKIGYYDFVFTSPPYEYLELYEGMEKYDGADTKMALSASKLKGQSGFYDKFIIPTLKEAYKYLPRGKFMCINMPDIMYKEIVKRWKRADNKLDTYDIAKRAGSNMEIKDRAGKERVFCWKRK
jgi:16S rRNA G966 N2-methylase RsmD